MGNCSQLNEHDSSLTISEKQFEYTKLIGIGAVGKVWQVNHIKTKTSLALKVYEKSEIRSREGLNSILKERSLLSIMNCPFVVNMRLAFQDKKKLYLGLDLKMGGDLRFHLIRKRFREEEIKFILRCVVMALGHLRSIGVIHKDVKPENIVLDNNGYAFLTDFGTSELIKDQNSFETSGTPGYMAPEVICRQNHSFVSDYFSLGVILYEVIHNNRPYKGKTRQEIRESILSKQVSINKETIPEGWSEDCIDICNKLLKRKPDSRIGSESIKELESHPWFADIDADKLNKFELKAPFVPGTGNNFDEDHLNSVRRRNVRGKTYDDKCFVGYFFKPRLEIK